MDATLLLRGAWVVVGWDVNVHLYVNTTWRLRCCQVGHGLGWGGMFGDVDVHLHLHTTWRLRCCYMGHGLGWGGVGCKRSCVRGTPRGGESCVVGLDLQLDVAPQL